MKILNQHHLCPPAWDLQRPCGPGNLYSPTPEVETYLKYYLSISDLGRNDHHHEIVMKMAVWYYHYQPIQHRDENNYHYPPKNQVSSVSTVSTTTAGGLGGETREPWRWLQWARKPHAQAQVFRVWKWTQWSGKPHVEGVCLWWVFLLRNG